MSTVNYKPLQVKKFAKKAISDTPENKYWKKFKSVSSKSYVNAISKVYSGGNDLNLVAFTEGRIVYVYNTREEEVKQQFERFSDKVTGVALRKDGKMISTSEGNGMIKVWEVTRKTLLRTFHNHKKAVHATDFVQGESLLFSGSDDQSVKLYDIAGNNVIRTFVGAHSDFVRSIAVVPSTDRNLISTGYDGFAKLFDFRDKSKAAVREFNHEAAIEEVAMSSSGFSFATVGGTFTTIWDLRTGEPIERMNNNQKTVTCAKYISGDDRLVTGSIDQSIKVYRTDTYQVTHQFKMPNPIMSLDVTNNTRYFAVGMADGTLELRSNKKKLGEQRDSDDEDDSAKTNNDLGLQIPDYLKFSQAAERRVHTYKYFNRGMYDQPAQFDVKFEEKRQKKLGKYDRLLKKFQYRTALMHALENKQNDVVIALYEELLQRGELLNAFKNLDEAQLGVVFEFIAKKIANPKFQDVAIHMLTLMFEHYTYQSGKYLDSLVDILDGEISAEKILLGLSGQIDTILSSSIA